MATIAERLQAEINRANAVTGKADTTVHNAVGSLIAGFGQGGDGKLDLSVTDDQLKAYVYIPNHDKLLGICFAQSVEYGVTIDWGDGSSETPVGNISSSVEYAVPHQHVYPSSGYYLITLTALDGYITIGAIRNIFKFLHKNEIGQSNDKAVQALRKAYQSRLVLLELGKNIKYASFAGIPQMPKIPNDAVSIDGVCTTELYIPEGTTTIDAYFARNAFVEYIKFPSTITEIKNNAFYNCMGTQTFDFTAINLVDGAFPIVLSATNPFQGIHAKQSILFATEEIANAAKAATNWSSYASYIHYVGEAGS